MRLLYTVVIHILTLAIRLAALFHPKARAWVSGRRNWRKRYATAFQKKGKLLWVHVASLGEFEQGRPLIEAFRRKYPGWQIVLSFFSPSGYSIRKNYPHADFICYLPADTRRNARDFLDLFQPDAAVFIKYEFWANYLFELKRREIPTLLVSALFRPGQPFFKWYGAFWRSMLDCFNHIFLQNKNSIALLQQIGFQNYTVAGDTRVDRVLELAAQAEDNLVVRGFLSAPPPAPPPGGRGGSSRQEFGFLNVNRPNTYKENKKNTSNENPKYQEGIPPSPWGEGLGVGPGLIAGSTWPEDEAILLPLLENPDFQDLRWIIAPHEPSEKHLKQLAARLKHPFLRYSELNSKGATSSHSLTTANMLVIDNVGLLNSLYQYGWVAYIGGGFGKGIHNTLEPAAFGLPIIFGPKYEKFEEARQFVAQGGAFPIRNTAELSTTLIKLRDPDFYKKASDAVQGYLHASRGATQLVLQQFAAMSI